MKHWGDIVVVEHGDWHAYDWSWAGRRILDMLIGGPDLALRHIASLLRSDDREFYGVSEESGGALIDFDRHRLLFFGDDLMDQVSLRRILLPALACVWTGFQVGWAFAGTRELAAYVGLDCCPAPREHEPPIIVTADRYSPCQIVSVVATDGGVRFWPLEQYRHPEMYGPSLLDALPGRGRAKLTLKTDPASGVHTDPRRKTIGVWLTEHETGVLDRLPEQWPGWHFEFWEDRYEEQLDRCGDTLRVPPRNVRRDIDAVREAMRGRLYGRDPEGPAGEALHFASVLRRIAPHLALDDSDVVAGLLRPTDQQWESFIAACQGAGEIAAA
ncbi:hypothetical protein CRI77_20340 [Mycolicibacterium duvalii]|uniref:Uncharacterized protein n=1 Tax=Mycolicibacterium duvalii TaxID=39688 RepID=A0A7I7JWA2_9MYCO|nr:hypothetical protein [Mycolicibacterium duvalii]MCV7370953.1 hypothetical protein [Mycolicibacterium duvalii]PEG37525.1 hypothetical protein CRI77_20340 [Mycolicibacterium duvalii]BBX15531.1 hypothetical protein MDUV_03910 [Mycolicibacterium duvalii]